MSVLSVLLHTDAHGRCVSFPSALHHLGPGIQPRWVKSPGLVLLPKSMQALVTVMSSALRLVCVIQELSRQIYFCDAHTLQSWPAMCWTMWPIVSFILNAKLYPLPIPDCLFCLIIATVHDKWDSIDFLLPLPSFSGLHNLVADSVPAPPFNFLTDSRSHFFLFRLSIGIADVNQKDTMVRNETLVIIIVIVFLLLMLITLVNLLIASMAATHEQIRDERVGIWQRQVRLYSMSVQNSPGARLGLGYFRAQESRVLAMHTEQSVGAMLSQSCSLLCSDAYFAALDRWEVIVRASKCYWMQYNWKWCKVMLQNRHYVSFLLQNVDTNVNSNRLQNHKRLHIENVSMGSPIFDPTKRLHLKWVSLPLYTFPCLQLASIILLIERRLPQSLTIRSGFPGRALGISCENWYMRVQEIGKLNKISHTSGRYKSMPKTSRVSRCRPRIGTNARDLKNSRKRRGSTSRRSSLTPELNPDGSLNSHILLTSPKELQDNSAPASLSSRDRDSVCRRESASAVKPLLKNRGSTVTYLSRLRASVPLSQTESFVPGSSLTCETTDDSCPAYSDVAITVEGDSDGL